MEKYKPVRFGSLFSDVRTKGKIFFKFCGLLTISQFYLPKTKTCPYLISFSQPVFMLENEFEGISPYFLCRYLKKNLKSCLLFYFRDWVKSQEGVNSIYDLSNRYKYRRSSVLQMCCINKKKLHVRFTFNLVHSVHINSVFHIIHCFSSFVLLTYLAHNSPLI